MCLPLSPLCCGLIKRADLVDISNVDSSPAIQFLEQLRQAGTLTDEKFALLKSKYARIQSEVLQHMENEKSLLVSARTLQSDLSDVKRQVESAHQQSFNNKQTLSVLRRDKAKAEGEVEKALEKEEATSIEVNEVQQELEKVQAEYESMKKAKEDAIRPRLEQLNNEIFELKDEVSRHQLNQERLTQEQRDGVHKAAMLERDRASLATELDSLRDQHERAAAEPDRHMKNSEVLKSTLSVQQRELNKLSADLTALQTEAELVETRQKGLEAERLKLRSDLQRQRAVVEQRNITMNETKRNLDLAREKVNDLLADKASVELRLRNASDKVRFESDAAHRASKAKDGLIKELRRKEYFLRESERDHDALLPVREEVSRTIESLVSETHRLKKQHVESQKDVDIRLDQVIQQERMTSGEVERVKASIQELKDLEDELVRWHKNIAEIEQQAKVVTKEREIKSHEASEIRERAQAQTKEIRMRDLAVRDLEKRVTELDQRLAESSKLYEMVKNDKNKFMALIQAHTEEAAEMKDKLKIYENEIEIRRNESHSKEKALLREKMQFEHDAKERDQLRHENNKAYYESRQRAEEVTQYVTEISKLNSIINHAERELLRIKQEYERAVQQRNYVGIQLIDRNDELCILYEKSNIQESRLRNAEILYRQREQEIRMQRFKTSELQREIAINRRLLPKIPELENQVVVLMTQLSEEREAVEELCIELEDPSNDERFKQLGGNDPTPDDLEKRRRILEGRLNKKEEQAMEKKLLLEQITQLTENARLQATEGREGTLALAKKVNSFQNRIKTLTRKMMATVSELSMYQATALKLEQEKLSKAKELTAAHERLANGLPPTDDAEEEWYRMERLRQRRIEDRYARQEAEEGRAMADAVGEATRSTAQPRPNSYIDPDDVLGLPKPYGNFAPFKYQQPGSTMRHVRKPTQKEIEI